MKTSILLIIFVALSCPANAASVNCIDSTDRGNPSSCSSEYGTAYAASSQFYAIASLEIWTGPVGEYTIPVDLRMLAVAETPRLTFWVTITGGTGVGYWVPAIDWHNRHQPMGSDAIVEIWAGPFHFLDINFYPGARFTPPSMRPWCYDPADCGEPFTFGVPFLVTTYVSVDFRSRMDQGYVLGGITGFSYVDQTGSYGYSNLQEFADHVLEPGFGGPLMVALMLAVIARAKGWRSLLLGAIEDGLEGRTGHVLPRPGSRRPPTNPGQSNSTGCGVRTVPLPQRKSSAGQSSSHPEL